MESNLPATRDELKSRSDEPSTLTSARPLRVALMPLALVTFVLLALIMAAWTFLATAT